MEPGNHKRGGIKANQQRGLRGAMLKVKNLHNECEARSVRSFNVVVVECFNFSCNEDTKE